MVSTVGTSLDRVQEFGKPLCFSLLHLKQALGQVTITTSEQLGEAHLLCVDLEYPEPQFATPEGEGTAAGGNDLGRDFS